MRSKRTALVFVVVLSLTLGGCLGGGSGGGGTTTVAGTTQTPATASDLTRQAVAAMEGVETYRYVKNMTLVQTQNNATVRTHVNVSGLVDAANRKWRSKTVINSPALEVELMQYVVGTTKYTEEPSGWNRTQLADGSVWQSQPPAVRHATLLNASEMAVTERTTLDGTKVVVLTGSPSDQQATNLFAGATPGTENVTYRNVDYRAYVSTETHRLRRVEMSGTLVANNRSQSFSLTLTFNDYGTDAAVSLPAAATSS